jgi:hypothetical protein
MQPKNGCRLVQRRGWEQFPTQACVYPYSKNTSLSLDVVVLSPDKPQLARWLVHACRDSGAKYTKHCAERLALSAKCRSGAQFPVAGYVDEDGTIYTFRDGITARMLGQSRWTIRAADVAGSREAVFNAVPDRSGDFGRILSTTREEWARYSQTALIKPNSVEWIALVRKEYQAAWGNDRNRLMAAHVSAQLKDYDQPKWGSDLVRFAKAVAHCTSIRGYQAWR